MSRYRRVSVRSGSELVSAQPQDFTTASAMHVPCPDRGEASSVWRSETLRDLEWRARCLGLEANAEVQKLLAQLVEQSAAVESLWQQQQQDPSYEAPWWADGEYDDSKADSANDSGMAQLRSGSVSAAFESFTEAIRLCPRKAVYHCNRAAAALRLRRYDIAAEDSRNAAERDPSSAKALVRGGRAQLGLSQPELAVPLFAGALQLAPDDKAAQAGLEAGERLLSGVRAAASHDAAAAASGTRAALPREAPPDDDAAAENLLAAEAMLRANPRLEAAKCSRVEAFLLCRRWGDARSALAGLLSGADRDYLQAELDWRSGDLGAALGTLRQASAGRAAAAKCTALEADLQRWLALEAQSEEALDDGRFQDCIDVCTSLLDAIPAAAASGLAACVLHRRAAALSTRRLYADALLDLERAAALEPGDGATLLLRAQVFEAAGRYQDAFLALQRLKAIEPDTPGLMELQQKVATLCLGSRSRTGSTSNSTGPADGHHAVLGVACGASQQEVRRAYHKLAAQWHPDKWGTAAPDQQAEAESRFRSIKDAHEALADDNFS